MLIMKNRILYFCCVYLFGLLCVRSSEFDRSQIAAGLISHLEGVKAIQYKSQCYEVDNSRPSAFLEWTEDTLRNKFKFWEVDVHNVVQFSSLRAFDGERLYWFLDKEKLLYTKIGDEILPSEIRNQMSILAPFEFLINEEKEDIWNSPQLGKILEQNTLKKVESKIKSIRNEQLNGLNCTVVELNGINRDRFLGIPVTYRIFLSVKDSFYPISWSTYEASNRKISEMQCEKLESFRTNSPKKIILPTKLTIKYYAPTKEAVLKSPSNTQIFTYSDIKINDIEEPDYAIDPSIADRLIDLDSKKSIAIPRDY